jgi:hypothetical protein
MVLVRQTVLIARAESVRGDFDAAYQQTISAKLDFERQLAADPQFFYKQLYRYERPRMCGDDTIIPPQNPAAVNDAVADAEHSTPWPSSCPTTWTYHTSGVAMGEDSDGNRVSYDPEQHPIRVEISPPTPTRPTLQVKILAYKGQTETGLTASYRPSSATSVTAFSQSDLSLDALFSSPGAASAGAPTDVTVRGTLYAGGQLYLPTAKADFAGAQLFAEGGFVGSVPDSGRFYTTTSNNGGAPATAATAGDAGVRDIRQVVPTALTMDGLRGSYTHLEALGCPGGQPSNTEIDQVQLSTALCLRHGSAAITTDSQATTVSTTGANVGDRPAAYLLMWSGTEATPTVRVFTAATPPAATGECLIQCDLTTLARPDFAASRHPASLPAATRSAGQSESAPLWQPLGEFALPASGVIVTDADTYLGQCAAAIAGPGASCETTVAARGVTVVAGSPRDPRDIVLSGPSAGAPEAGNVPAAHVGLVATRSVVVPFYARPAQGNLNVSANIVAFGYGLKTGQSALRAFPSTQGPYRAESGNFGDTLTLRGSIAAPSLEAALPGWARVTVEADPTAVAAPPPNFPGFSNAWVPQGSARLSPHDVCALPNCSSVW